MTIKHKALIFLKQHIQALLCLRLYEYFTLICKHVAFTTFMRSAKCAPALSLGINIFNIHAFI